MRNSYRKEVLFVLSGKRLSADKETCFVGFYPVHSKEFLIR